MTGSAAGPSGCGDMAGGTKRLPRAVREQQMPGRRRADVLGQRLPRDFDGRHRHRGADPSRCSTCITGSKEELFGACPEPGTGAASSRRWGCRHRHRAVRMTRCAARSCRCCATSTPINVLDRAVYAGHQFAGLRAHRPGGREKIIDMAARLLEEGTRKSREPDTDFHIDGRRWWAPARPSRRESALATRDVDEAAELLINLFWRGLGKGSPPSGETH